MFDLKKSNERKKPVLIIAGFAACILLIICGVIIESIVGADGLIAVIAISVGFLVLAGCLLVENIRRKKAAAAEDKTPLPAESQRFLRHSDAPDDSRFSDGFSDGFEDEETSGTAAGVSSEPLKPLRRPLFSRGQDDDAETPQDDGDMGQMSPQKSLFVRRRPAQDEQQYFAGDASEPLPSRRAAQFADDNDDRYDPDYDSGSPFDRYADDDIEDMPDDAEEFKPALRFDAPDESGTEPADESDDYTEPEDEADAESFSPTDEPAPIDVIPDEPTPAQPAKNVAAAASASVVSAPVSAAANSSSGSVPQNGGQTLDSFFEDMSEEDLLYRDCVEVWAADAKPCLLRLMKYIEGIEDRHTAALFGRECEYINAMIDRIYCFTQLDYVDEQLELKEYNFSALVKECLRRFSPFLMEKRIGLLWKGLDINVMTDRRWFVFALTQIIFNSVEFTPEGGKIAISARQKGEWIDLLVDDSGKGITADEMPYVFVAGYMGDDSPNESGRRTGMGLFIARSVINKMGGDVFAESNPGKGTRVIIRLPYVKPVSAQ